jgi:NADH-quinone oxidoreductase subunit B
LKEARWYKKDVSEVIPVPVLGPDIMDPREYEQIRQYAQEKAQKVEAKAVEEQGS